MRNRRLTQTAQTLRQQPTDSEHHLWQALRMQQIAGAKFRRQRVIGPYIVDFCCLEQRLVVEVDGSQHLESADDATRDAWLSAHGWRVLRFWNDQVLKETEAVLQVIWEAVRAGADSPHPSPPPPCGGG